LTTSLQILALFESCAHPEYTPDRFARSLVTLDELIRSLSLTSIDAHDRDVVRFPPGQVPVVLLDGGGEEGERKCSCIAFMGDSHTRTGGAAGGDSHNVGGNAHSVSGGAGAGDSSTNSTCPPTLPWDPAWTAREVRDEEIRRLCWGALVLVAGFSAQCAAFNKDMPKFFLMNPANVRLPFYPLTSFPPLFSSTAIQQCPDTNCINDSTLFCSQAKYSTVCLDPPPPSPPHSPQKRAFGRCTAVHCYYGVSAPETMRRTSALGTTAPAMLRGASLTEMMSSAPATVQLMKSKRRRIFRRRGLRRRRLRMRWIGTGVGWR
jgi:hypothetical protein